MHEAAVGVLEAIGGTALSNLGSLVMAAVLVVALVLLLQRERVPNPELAAAFVVANPWFQVAATSTVDFVWAMALATLGALALRTGRAVAAGVLFASGDRMSHVDGGRRGRRARRTALRGHDHDDGTRSSRAAVAAVASILVYLPPFFAAGSSLAFANNDFATSTPLNHLGRALAKDLYFFGPVRHRRADRRAARGHPRAPRLALELAAALRHHRPRRVAAAVPALPLEDGPPGADLGVPRRGPRRRAGLAVRGCSPR